MAMDASLHLSDGYFDTNWSRIFKLVCAVESRWKPRIYSQPQVFSLWLLNPYMDPGCLLIVVCEVHVCPAQVVTL